MICWPFINFQSCRFLSPSRRGRSFTPTKVILLNQTGEKQFALRTKDQKRQRLQVWSGLLTGKQWKEKRMFVQGSVQVGCNNWLKHWKQPLQKTALCLAALQNNKVIRKEDPEYKQNRRWFLKTSGIVIASNFVASRRLQSEQQIIMRKFRRENKANVADFWASKSYKYAHLVRSADTIEKSPTPLDTSTQHCSPRWKGYPRREGWGMTMSCGH